MSIQSENNNRIAKNSIFLYIRMLFTMAVSLYTSRVILNVLGVEDFGIFNVVGGVIAMLSFLNNSLSGASSRFLTFELGKGNNGNLKKMFSAILCIHCILALIIILIGETIGLWFVSNKLVIPIERMTAALWVYHCSIITAMISVISVPYYSIIIATEKMNAFAYISIIEVILKLIIVWILTLLPYDKLIIYAILYLLVQLLIRVLYNIYCSKNIHETNVLPVFHFQQMKEIFVYAGWTMNGYLAIIGYTQGINILLNLFYGPVVNAARGISVQVQNAVSTFVANFQTAINPQIIKSYAAKDMDYLHTLVIASSKYGFYLMLLISFPVLICIHPILKLWLGVVPEYTSNFVCVMLLIGMIQPLRSALITGIHATGDIRKFQIFEGTSLLTVVPISYVLLKLYHISPEMVMIVYLCVEIITQCIRVWIVLPKIEMKYMDYFQKSILPLLLPFSIILFCMYCFSISQDISIIRLFVVLMLTFIFTIFCIYILGLNKKERNYIKSFIKKIR